MVAQKKLQAKEMKILPMYKYSPKNIGKKRQPSSPTAQNQIEQEGYQRLLVNTAGFMYDDDAPKSVTEESSCL